MSCRIVTFNANGLNNTEKRRAVFNFYRKQADILCLQETHSTKESEAIWSSEWGGVCLFAHGTSAARGVAILINRKFYTNVLRSHLDESGRYIIVDVETNECVLTIINIYAPNFDSPGFFEAVLSKSNNFKGSKILIGDYNLVLDTDLDRRQSTFNHHKAAEMLKLLAEMYYLDDPWRVTNPDVKRYSWYKMHKGNVIAASRIDFALVNQGLLGKIQLSMYFNGVMSDHSAFYMCIQMVEQERGPGYWKINNSLLRDPEYVTKINAAIDEALRQESSNSICKWEHLKMDIAKLSRSFANNRAAEQKLITAQLQEKVCYMEEDIDSLTVQERGILEESKKELDFMLLEKAKGCIFRSKAQWICEGERNTKYFYSLERARSESKTCQCLIVNGEEIVNQNRILEEQRRFYKELYSKDEHVLFDDQDLPIPKMKVLADTPAASEEFFSEKEIATAVSQLANNKTPGPDGISIDFYKVFWKRLAPIFTDVCLEIYENSMMPESSRIGVINLIPKKGRDTRLLRNLRPITLLNSDYKIIERLLANRIVPALEYLVDFDQSGFLPGRRISNNIRRLFDLIKYAETNQVESVLCCLDFEKAFDKISTDSILGVLNYYGFSRYIRKWTSILYSGFEAKTQNNGYFSAPFCIEKSVHQGGPNSCYYFILVIELLADIIRQNKNIKGLTCKEIIYLLNQYADDMNSTMLDEETSIQNFFADLERFRTLSGLTVNYEKTLLYRLNEDDKTEAKQYTLKPIKWSTGNFEVLGIKIHREDKQSLDLNYDCLETKVEAILKLWAARNLSLEGKINVINTLIQSLFIYKMAVLPTIPEEKVKKFEMKFEKFLWNNKRPKIPLKTLQLSREKGGLQLADLKKRDASMKISWIRTVSADSHTANLAYEIIHPKLRDRVWCCNLKQTDVECVIYDNSSNSFWKDVLKAWCSINYSPCLARWQPIWWNSLIKIGYMPVLWTKYLERGLVYIEQLYDDRTFKTYAELQQNFGLSMMDYNMLKSAVQKANRIQEAPNQTSQPLVNDLMYAKDIVKRAYKMLMDQEDLPETVVKKWSLHLNMSLTAENLSKAFLNAKYVTLISKYRSFQFRMLHRAIVTNTQLKKWKIVDSDTCFYCKQEPETFDHLFWSCEKIREFWECFKVFVDQKYGTDVKLTAYAVFFNVIFSSNANHITNFLCLVAKQVIYKQRCLKQNLTLSVFKNHLSIIENSEKYYAVKNQKLNKHLRKWYPNGN